MDLVGPLEAEDTWALARCLTAMGAAVAPSTAGLSVHGPLRGSDHEVILDAGESGTAARFLAALAAATPGRFRLVGSPRLERRPMAGLVAALRAGGADVASEGQGDRMPLAIRGGTLRSGPLTVDATSSSQFVSALLLAAVAVEGGLEVRPEGPFPSAPYVEATRDALEAFGHGVSVDGGGFRVGRGASASPRRYEIPGDYSSAIPLLACAGILGGEVGVAGLAWPSRDADAGALACLASMGLELSMEPGRVRAACDGAVRPLEAVATDFPDSVPALAALAAFSPGTSRIAGIAHLRGKESDRIASVAALLRAAGGSVREERDALVIDGGLSLPRAARLPTAADHRLVMAASLIALRRSGTLIEGPGHVRKSYPRFFADLESLLLR